MSHLIWISAVCKLNYFQFWCFKCITSLSRGSNLFLQREVILLVYCFTPYTKLLLPIRKLVKGDNPVILCNNCTWCLKVNGYTCRGSNS